MLSGRMAAPANPEEFDAFEGKDLKLFVERGLAEPGEAIEFLIPHVGKFTITPTA
jgi:hypothetical protein